MKKSRRQFIKEWGQYTAAAGLFAFAGGLSGCGGSDQSADGTAETAAETAAAASTSEMFFKISLAQWSLNKSLFGGKLDNLDFAAKARNDFGIGGIEYVNQFFADKAKDTAYLNEMIKRADDNGVRSLLIMIDREGGLGDPNGKERTQAVENHYKWVDAAKHLGCHSIRVNAFGVGSAEEVAKAAVEGLGTLGEYAAKVGLNVIVENHGGYSSNGAWLAGVMKEINMSNVGTLPDFGNFCIKRDSGTEWGGNCIEEYDRYQGVREMMPFAKAVSAKATAFDENGNEKNTDYFRIMQIVKDAGYTGYVGIEYEGEGLSEDEGIMATKRLLERVGQQLS